MEYCYFPDVVQVVPFEDYTVDVYFDDGKIVRYDAMPFLEDGIISTTTELCRRAGSRMLTENGISWHTMALCRLA